MKIECLPRVNSYLLTKLLLLFIISFKSATAQVDLVKDLNTAGDPWSQNVRNLVDVAGTVYFVSEQSLWKTDGTPEGTLPVKKFKWIDNLINLNGTLLFAANDSLSEDGIWKSDGTEAGTLKIKTAPSSSKFTLVNDYLYFSSGSAIWKTDGTSGGTVRVKKLSSGSRVTHSASANNSFFFVANTGGYGYELWVSDGTEVGTKILKDIMPGKKSSAPNYLTASGGFLYFMAKDPEHGQEIWKTDGTTEGTALVKDVRPGAISSFPRGLIDVNGMVFFIANDGVHGFEFWKTNGTAASTALVIDLEPGRVSGLDWLHNMGAAGSLLYFQVGYDIYISDGTTSGTQNMFTTYDFYDGGEFKSVGDVMYYMDTNGVLRQFTGFQDREIRDTDGEGHYYSASGSQLTPSGNLIFFTAANENLQPCLWRSDGTYEGTFTVKVKEGSIGSFPSHLTDVNGILFFRADYGDYNSALWRSDGTATGTQVITENYSGNPTSFKNGLYFTSYSGLWKSDGTVEGTGPVKDINNSPSQLRNINGTLYFNGYSYPEGHELWKSDGTAAGTFMVRDVPGGSGNPSNFVGANGLVFYTAQQTGFGIELWKSDGTASGTTRVKDINLGSNSSNPHSLVSLNNELFFIAYQPGTGYELWKSNGTENGTHIVKDINQNDDGVPADIWDLKVLDNTLYFLANDAASGTALWKSDGTTLGTVKVKNFYDGNEHIHILTLFNNEVYLLVSDPSFKDEALWKTDGTIAGTTRVKWISDEGSYSTPATEELNGKLYINLTVQINHYVPGTQIWRTDGTECGTFKVEDTRSGSISLERSGNTLFYAGDYGNVGIELLKINESEITPPTCAPLSGRTDDAIVNTQEVQSDEFVSTFPNPYQHKFSLRVKGADNEIYKASVINSNGIIIEAYSELECNVEYGLGGGWNNGVYLIKIHKQTGSFTKKVIKNN